MEHAPHTPLKNRVKEYVASKLGLKPSKISAGDPEDEAGQQFGNSNSNGDLVHIGPAIQKPGCVTQLRVD